MWGVGLGGKRPDLPQAVTEWKAEERGGERGTASLDWADLPVPMLCTAGSIWIWRGIMEKSRGSFQMKNRLVAGV